jgi:hypothetical protein
LLVAVAGSAAAQATGTTYFYAPYRAFDRHEFGGTVSFLSGDLTGFEGLYSFGYRNFDIGLRGGIVDAPLDEVFVVGTSARVRLISHNEQFPLDGALVVGVGGQFNGGSQLLIPGGLTIGRRVDIEDSDVSLVLYGQPTLWFGSEADAGDPGFLFGVGFGVDVRIGGAFDLRGSFGLGGVEGVSISAVWVR